MGFQHALAVSRTLRPTLAKADGTATADAASLTDAERDELRGLADGLEMAQERVLVWQMRMRTVPAVGSLAAITARRNGSGGMALAVSFSGESLNLLQIRRPERGLPHAVVAEPGCLGGPGGLNADGLAVIAAGPASSRVSSLLEHARTIDEAINLLRQATPPGAWSVCLAHHPTDRLCLVEGDGASQKARDVDALNVTETGFPAEHIGSGLILQPAAGLVSLRTAGESEPVRGTVEQSAPVNNAPERRDGESLQNTPPLPPVAEMVTSRYVLRMMDTPQPPDSPTRPEFHGPALVFGDNPVARALRYRLEQFGVVAHNIPAADYPDRIVAELDRLWRERPIPHLFLTTPHDPDAGHSADEADWKRRRTRGVLGPYLLCQAWVKRVLDAGLTDQASLVAAAALGGDFGLSGRVGAIESGALTGLLKAIIVELWVAGHRKIPIKLLDAAAGAPAEEVVEAVFRELAVPSYDVEISHAGGKRRVVRALPQSLAGPPSRPIQHGGNWVFTGGARGITAYVAREMGLRYGLKLHLIGTAPPPQVDPAWRDLSDQGRRDLKIAVMQKARADGLNPLKEWLKVEKALEIDATLRELASLGVRATYHTCDVADRRALAEVLRQVRAQDGPIQGVVHGAGIGQDARFDRKKRDKVNQCFDAKIDGLAALMELTAQDPLRYLVAFGSISGRFGANGHSDYSAANDMMAKQIDAYRRRRPEVAAVAFHWHAWGDVGMATKPETKLALELIDMKFMLAAEGLRHLLAELEAGAPEGEVLITDNKYHRLFYPGRTVVEENPPTSPLLGDVAPEGEKLRAELIFDPGADPFLREHRFQQKPLLPLVIGLEALCEAAVGLAPAMRVVAVRDIEAVRGLRFHGPNPVTAHVHAARDGASVRGELRADFLNREGRLVASDRLYLTAAVELDDSPPSFKGTAPVVCEGGWHSIQYLGPDAPVYHGPPLQALRSVRVEGERLLGKIKALPLAELVGPQRAAGWLVPSGVLDACLYATAVLAWKVQNPTPSLPARLGQLRFARQAKPGEDCLVEVRLVRKEPGGACCAFRLFGADGRPILEAEEYRIVWLG
jgi:NAD(P)-dependent dehydrogenase (short-subunit alcohol dehydrogenase family)